MLQHTMKPRYLVNDYAFFVSWLPPTFSAPHLWPPARDTPPHLHMYLKCPHNRFLFLTHGCCLRALFHVVCLAAFHSPSETAHTAQLPKGPRRFLPPPSLSTAVHAPVMACPVEDEDYTISISGARRPGQCVRATVKQPCICSVTTL